MNLIPSADEIAGFTKNDIVLLLNSMKDGRLEPSYNAALYIIAKSWHSDLYIRLLKLIIVEF